MNTSTWKRAASRALAFMCLGLLSTQINAVEALAQAQTLRPTVLFEQDFSSGSNFSNYSTSSVPFRGRFTTTTVAGSSTASINSNGRLQMVRNGGNVGFAGDLRYASTAPTAFMAAMDVWVSGAGTSNTQPALVFQVGPTASVTATDPVSVDANTAVATQFGINFASGQSTAFQLRNITGNNNNTTNRTSGTRLYFVANRSGAAVSYAAPNGTVVSLTNNQFHLWAGTTQVYNNGALQNSGLAFERFKLVFNNTNSASASVEIDNLQIEDLMPVTTSVVSGGSYSIGVNRNFPSLSGTNGAFTRLNTLGTATSTTRLLISTDVFEPTNVALSASGASASARIEIRPDSTVARLVLGNNNSNPSGITNLLGMIQFNGSDNILIDGRAIGQTSVSADKLLTFRNINTNSGALMFYNSASDNVIQFNKIESRRASANGASLCFSNSGGFGGNNNNIIQYNDFQRDQSTTDGSLRPQCMLQFLDGTSGGVNTGNIVYRNNFIDFGRLAAGQSSAVVYARTGYDDLAVRYNSMYYTSAIDPNGNNSIFCYWISNANGDGMVFSNNYIGGTAPQAGGSAMSVNASTGGFVRLMPFRGDNVAANAAIDSNVIDNFAGTHAFLTCNNEQSWNSNISGASNLSFRNNKIGSTAGINLTTTFASNATVHGLTNASFMVITTTGGTNVISGNEVKNITFNQVNNASNADAGAGQTLNLFTISGNANVTNNTVGNVTVNVSGTNDFATSLTALAISGISTDAVVSGNVVENIVNNSAVNSSTITNCTAPGTAFASATPVTSTTAMSVSAAGGNASVFRNRISGISGLAGTVSGLALSNSGTGQIDAYNNIVVLNPGASSIANARAISVTGSTGGGTITLAYNTAVVAGTSTEASATTYAFYRDADNNTTLAQNNIFYNGRTGLGTHYALANLNIAGTSTLTLADNVYYNVAATNLGLWGATTLNTLADLQAASSSTGDNSVEQALTFTNLATGDVTLSGCGLPGSAASTLNSPFPAVSTDFAGANRVTPTPGAFYFTTGAGGTTSTWTGGGAAGDWFDANNWCGFGVPDATIDVTIPDDNSITNWPQIGSGTASTKNLTINGQLTVTGSATLAVSGNFNLGNTGVLTTSSGSTISFPAAANQSISNLNTNGNVSVSGGSNKVATFTEDATIEGVLTIATASNVAIASGKTLTLNGTTAGAGAIQATSFGNLTIGGVSASNITLPVTQVSNLTISRTGGGNAVLGANLLVNDLNINTGSTLVGNGFNLTVRGDYSAAGTGTYNGGNSGTVTFDGVGTQTINGDLTANNFTASRVASGTVSLASGTLTVNGTFSNATAATTFSVASGSTLNLGGTFTNAGTFNFNSAANLGLTGTATWPVSTINNVNTLTVSSPNVVAPANLTVSNLVLNTGAVLQISNLTVNNNYTRNGGVIKGSATSNLTIGASGTVTGTLAFGPNAGTDRSLNTLTLNKPMTLGSDLSLSSLAGGSVLTVGANKLTVPGSADFTKISAGASSTLAVTGGSSANLGGVSSLAALEVNGAGGVSVGNLTVGSLTLNSGNVNVAGGATLTYTGSSSPTVVGSNHVSLATDAVYRWTMPAISGTLLFPVGPGTGYSVTGYRPVTFSTATNVANGTSVAVSFGSMSNGPTTATNVDPSGNTRSNVAVNINVTGTLPSAGVTLTANASDFNTAITDVNELAIFRGKTAPWERIGSSSVINGTPIQVLRNGVTLNSGNNLLVIGESGGVDLPAGSTGGLFVWTGVLSTDWATAGNWDQLVVPNASNDNVIIPNLTRKPVISGSIEVGNLQINANSMLTLTATGSLTVSGTVTVNGSLMGEVGSSVTFAGSTNQTLAGVKNKVHNITVNKGSSTLTLNSGLDVTGQLLLSSGIFNLNSQNVRLLSGGSYAGSIGPLSTPANLQNSTNVSVQGNFRRPENPGSFYFISLPFTGKTLSDVTAITPVTIGGTTPSAYYYDPFGSTASGGWVPAPAMSFSLAPTRGAYVYIRRNIFDLPRLGFMMTGSIVKGSISTNNDAATTLKYCASGCATAGENGFNLIGNPYPSSIDFNSGGISLNNVDNYYAVYRTDVRNYAYYVRNDLAGTLGATNVIPAMQGFVVRATSAGASVNFTETAKTAAVKQVMREAAVPTLRMRITSPDNLPDEALVRFRASSVIGTSATDFDAVKFNGSSVNIATEPVAGTVLAINSMPMPAYNQVLPVIVNGQLDGRYTISFTELPTDLSTEIYLKDNYTGTFRNVKSIDQYVFHMTSDAATRAANRFELVFTPSMVSGVNLSGVKAGFSAYPNPAATGQRVNVMLTGVQADKAVISVVDVVGKVVSRQVIDVTNAPAELKEVLPAGVYTVVAEAGDVRQTQKLVIR